MIVLRTVTKGFQDFLPKLTPSDSESEAAKNHRASISEELVEDAIHSFNSNP